MRNIGFKVLNFSKIRSKGSPCSSLSLCEVPCFLVETDATKYKKSIELISSLLLVFNVLETNLSCEAIFNFKNTIKV